MADWESIAAEHGAALTAALRTERGAADGAELRPVQVAALVELQRCGGLFLRGRVGCGKSLFAMLAPTVLGAERPLILMPGGMVRPFRAMMTEMRRHWRIPLGLVIKSYQEISRMPAAGATIVSSCGAVPDLIVADEVQWLANAGPGGSAVANQVQDLLLERPEIRFAAATGTASALDDHAHLIQWALRGRSPLPADASELALWESIIDEGNDEDPQALAYLARIFACELTVPSIRAAYRARLRAAPGIIIKDDPFRGVPLGIRTVQLPDDPALQPHFVRLRTLRQRPDGTEPGEIGEREPDRIEGPVWTTARRMARGLCYVYNPPPPQEWRDARRAYSREVRAAIESGEAYTELQARQQAEEEPESPIGEALIAWRAAADAVGPLNQETLWLSERILDWCAAWGARERGLIFVDDRAFGRLLSLRTDWTYYGEGGVDSRGRAIEAHLPGIPAIASRNANGTGRNLQKIWSKMLIVTGPSSADALEQNVGRLHREGQELPVQVDLLILCPEDISALENLFRRTTRTQESFCDLGISAANWS